GVLHALAKLGVVVWNDARSIERCVDKSMTSFLLARAGVPTPPTWTMESLPDTRALVEREEPSGPLVLKPLFGAQGKGLRLVRRPEDLPGPEDIAGVYYLQRFQSNGTQDFTDYRLFVLRGRVVAAMMRRAPTWITNVKQGGQPVAVAPDPKMERLAVAAAEAVGAAIAGVDVLVGADGVPTVLEVNSMPAWSGVQKVSKRNIAEAIAARGARVGSRIREAVDATLKAVGQNTNLGIILLCAPLAAAAEVPEVALRVALATVLDGLNRTDTADVFAAIVAANPGGLGR